MAAEITNIIDIPALAGIDVKATQEWLEELKSLDQSAREVKEAIEMAKGLLAIAKANEVKKPTR